MNTTKNPTPQAYADFLSAIREFVPSDRIYTDELRTLGWGTDASFYREIPKVVVRSDGEQELAGIVQACRKHGLPFTFRAAGTSLSGQSLSNSVLIVAGKHWEKYELGERQETIRLQPGIIGAKVNEILKPFGRVFPPDPASIGSAMVGGIVCNNASGMNCGVHANSDRMLLSARIVLTDGTVVDTGSEESKAAFRKSHPEFIQKIEALRDRVRADKELTERILKKYSIKNVTGLNIRPLVAYDDPFDIMAHVMTKRGSADNIITYEHFCDTKEDMADIKDNEIALGSVCVVLSDESENNTLQFYLAKSDKSWIKV